MKTIARRKILDEEVKRRLPDAELRANRDLQVSKRRAALAGEETNPRLAGTEELGK
jgi:hypothetical protein